MAGTQGNIALAASPTTQLPAAAELAHPSPVNLARLEEFSTLPTFSGSAALDGTDLDDADAVAAAKIAAMFDDQDDLDDIESIVAQGTSESQKLAIPASHAGTRRAPSPYGSIGAIGGHRSPSLLPQDGASSSRAPSFDVFRQPPFESNVHASLSPLLQRTASPRAPSPLAFGAASAFGSSRPLNSSASFQAFRPPSPSFFATSAQSLDARDSPTRSSTQQIAGPSLILSPTSPPLPSSSPGAPERPHSRLDISKLQQRSQAAAQASASSAQGLNFSYSQQPPQYHHQQQSPAHPQPPQQQHHQRLGNANTSLSPPRQDGSQLGYGQVPFRPPMAPRTLSTEMMAASGMQPMGSLSPVSPGLGGSHANGMVNRTDGYPFPAPQQQFPHNPMISVDRRQNNQSRSSQRNANRTLSPMDPSRLRFASPAPVSLPAQDPTALTQRLSGLENAVEELTRGLSSVARNMAWLMERERERGAAPPLTAPQLPQTPGTGDTPHTAAGSEDVRVIGQQLSALSMSVQQLMTMQSQQGHSQQAAPAAIPGHNGDQKALRTQARMSSPPNFINSNFLSATASHINRSGATSPASSVGIHRIASPQGNVSSTQMMPPPQDIRSTGQRHATNSSSNRHPSDGHSRSAGSDRRMNQAVKPSSVSQSRDAFSNPNAVAHEAISSSPASPKDGSTPITKWDHLNLQPDLLRCVNKYGLGPPNKIQQRALPFLLRGSDVIAQAPPTQERIACYVIPTLQMVLTTLRSPHVVGTPAAQATGPLALIITTTIDQATQAQRMALGLGAPLGVKVHIAAAGGIDTRIEAQNVIDNRPHIVIGTPAKMSDLVMALCRNRIASWPNLAEVRTVILDEVDQLIARNMSDLVAGMLRVLPPIATPLEGNTLMASEGQFDPFEGTPTRGGHANTPSLSIGGGSVPPSPPALERQTAIFSNTVPQDVMHFAQNINLRGNVRVLVRKEGTTLNHGNHSISSGISTHSSGNNNQFHGPSSVGAVNSGGNTSTYPQGGGGAGGSTVGHGRGHGGSGMGSGHAPHQSGGLFT